MMRYHEQLTIRLVVLIATLFLSCRHNTQQISVAPAKKGAEKVFSGHVAVSLNGVPIPVDTESPTPDNMQRPAIRVPLEDVLKISGHIQLPGPGYLSIQLSRTDGVVVDSIGQGLLPGPNKTAQFAQELRVRTPGRYTVTAYLIAQDELQVAFRRSIELYHP